MPLPSSSSSPSTPTIATARPFALIPHRPSVDRPFQGGMSVDGGTFRNNAKNGGNSAAVFVFLFLSTIAGICRFTLNEISETGRR